MGVQNVKEPGQPASLEQRAEQMIEALGRERAGCIRHVLEHDEIADDLTIGGDDIGGLAHKRKASRFRKRIHEIDAEILHYGGEVPDDEYAKPGVKKAPARGKKGADTANDQAGGEADETIAAR